jgi:transposase
MPIVDEGALEEVFIPNKKVFALDRRCRQKNKITQTIAGLKKRISSFFHWVIPGLLDCFENKYGEVARAFYRQYADPFRAKELALEGLALFLKEAGNKDPELPEKVYQAVLRACELYQDALEYVDFNELHDELIEELDHLEERERALARVNAQIERLYEEVHPSTNLETVSGIRNGLAPEFIGMIGDPHRFSSNSKLVGYSGMYPEQDESGERSKKGLSITKEGPPRMRRAAYIASDIARQWDPQLAKIYYDQMVHKGNCHTQAVCAVAPHLLARVLTVLKEDRPYELRDPDGNPISKRDAKLLIEREYTVPEEVRERTRSRRRRQRRRKGGRATHTNESRQSRS